MTTLKFVALTLLAACSLAAAEEYKEEDTEWENEPEGSTIRVTSFAGKVAAIFAYSNGKVEGKSWDCHFKDGEIISAIYRHYRMTTKSIGEGRVIPKPKYDRLEVFHFPDHQLTGLDVGLKKELTQIIANATNQGGARQPTTAPESKPEENENPETESEGRSQ
ncbi:MAG: hypothetical protein ACI9MB_002843 [Verrucomicrobiales bacterium]|jgi:hypothetical protein